MIQASPGAALLAEVLAARDAFSLGLRKGEEIVDYRRRILIARMNLLAALDKLGPAAEGAS